MGLSFRSKGHRNDPFRPRFLNNFHLDDGCIIDCSREDWRDPIVSEKVCIAYGTGAISLIFMLPSIKQRAGEKLPQRDIQAIAQFFDGGDGDLLPAGVQHTVNSGGGDPGKVGQFIGTDAPLAAEFLKAFGNSVFYGHTHFTSRE